jgi:glycosyltransferase involved in cell wall biosynthesis
VLFIDHTAQLGGGEIAMRNLVEHLDRTHIEPVILLFSRGPLADQLGSKYEVVNFPLAAEIVETRKDSLGWNAITRIGTVLRMLASTWRLSLLIKSLDVHVVHTNTLKAHVLGGIAARIAGRPLVWHLRDRIAADYLPQAAIRLMRVLSQHLPNYVIANSNATLKTVLPIPIRKTRSGRISDRRFRVIHDGCDVTKSTLPVASGLHPQIGLIGRISPWKGQHIFIKAAAIVRKHFPSARFHIIGSPLFSETEYEIGLKNLCRDLGLDHTLDFRGFVQDVPRALSQLDVVVHASTVGEPFGQVVIEGMAARKPVIATNGGGIPEIVVDHVTGLLVPMGDEFAMANAMMALLSDPIRAKEMGERGEQRVIELFTLARCARAVEQVYADLLKRPWVSNDTEVASGNEIIDVQQEMRTAS